MLNQTGRTLRVFVTSMPQPSSREQALEKPAPEGVTLLKTIAGHHLHIIDDHYIYIHPYDLELLSRAIKPDGYYLQPQRSDCRYGNNG